MLRSRNGEDGQGEIVTGVGSLRRKYANTGGTAGMIYDFPLGGIVYSTSTLLVT